jgi:hypothetical protein
MSTVSKRSRMRNRKIPMTRGSCGAGSKTRSTSASCAHRLPARPCTSCVKAIARVPRLGRVRAQRAPIFGLSEELGRSTNEKMVRNARVRAVVKGAAKTGASVAAALLLSKMRGQLEEKMISRQIDELEPEIITELALLKANRAFVQSSGITPWAVPTVEVMRGIFHDHSGPSVTDTVFQS